MTSAVQNKTLFSIETNGTHGRLSDELLDIVLAYSVALLIAASSLWLFTRNNDFPVYYHPDEQSKVTQIATPDQPRNFNHPLLMLEAANLVRQWSDVPVDDTRAVAISGRWTSAAIAAIGVLALTLTGYVSYGWMGLLVCGVVMGLCPPLLVYAHYFKEDTTLISGLSIAILGACIIVRSKTIWPQLLGALVLGLGCAATASAKYVGLIVLLPAIFALLAAPVPKWWVIPARILLCFCTAGILLVLFNARAFNSFVPLHLKSDAWARIVGEFHHGTTGQGDVTLGRPNFFALSIAASEIMPQLWLAGIGAIAFTIWMAKSRRPTRWGMTLAIFLLTFAVILSFNAIPFPRHALPITVLGYFIIAQLVVVAIVSIGAIRPALQTKVLIASVASIVLLQGWRCVNFTNQFANDSRQRLHEWAAKNLPAGSVVALDRYAGLDSAGDPWRFPDQSKSVPFRITSSGQFAADAGSVTELASKGVGYVVTAYPAYERYFAISARAVNGQEASFERRREFYEDLSEHGQLIWSSIPSPPNHAYVDPQLRVYKVQ